MMTIANAQLAALSVQNNSARFIEKIRLNVGQLNKFQMNDARISFDASLSNFGIALFMGGVHVSFKGNYATKQGERCDIDRSQC